MKVLGVREMQAEIKRFNRELQQAEDPAAMAAAEPIADAWRSLVPVKDGHYRDAISTEWLGKQGMAGVGTAWQTSLPRNKQPFVYSQVLEFGDSDTAARPSARPALAASKDRAIEAGAEPIRARIRGRRPRKVAT